MRLANSAQQKANQGPRKPGGTKGCYWSPRDQKWSASIYVDGKKVSLGAYKRLEDARAARRDAEVRVQGEFAPAQDQERAAA